MPFPAPALPTIGGGTQFSFGNTNEVVLDIQPAPVAKTAAATLTAVELVNGMITYTGATANITLPTCADLDTLLSSAKPNSSFLIALIDLGGAGRATLTTNTGWTLVASMASLANVGARFRARKTGDGAWTLYRIA